MLLRFEAENYRSIKEPVELQMTAVNYYKESAEQLIRPQLPGLSNTNILRAAAIYGPNASGKSTIWRAIKTMQGMVLGAPSLPSDASLPFFPFMLDEESRDKPTSFSATFTAGAANTRYDYSFSYNGNAVVEEELAAYPKGLRQRWFRRSTTPEGTAISGSTHFKIPAAVKPLLNDNALALPMLANYRNIESSAKAQEIVGWFLRELKVYRALDAFDDFPYTGEILCGEHGSDRMRAAIQDMVRNSDIGISAAEVERKRMPPIPEEKRNALAALGFPVPDSGAEMKKVVLRHAGGGTEMKLGLGDESDGTRQLFGLSGHIAEALESGSTLVVDEIDASLHPILATEIVKSFVDPCSNPGNAQLVFTAHNPSLLEHDLLRRDQIWLTEKAAGGSTRLYPLSDYSPRKDESVATGYLTGRFSAIPVVPSCFGRCGDCEERDHG